MRATEVSFPESDWPKRPPCPPAHDSDLCLILVGDPVQNGHRLALAAGYHVDYLIGLQLRGLGGLYENTLRHMQVAKISRCAYVVFQTPADNRDLSATQGRNFNYLLDTGNKRGECRYYYSALSRSENAFECLTNYSLGWCVAGRLDVDTVRQEHQYVLFAQLSQPSIIGWVAIHRCLIDLEVSL